MPRQIDLNQLVRDVVVNEVREALAPYRQMFERVASLMRTAPAASRPAQPTASSKPRNTVKRRERAAPAGVAAEAKAAKPVRARAATPARPKAEPVAAPAPELPAPPAAVIPFNVGQRVIYRVGQGEIEATVVAIAGNQIVLDRVKDGKRIKRPVTKVAVA